MQARASTRASVRPRERVCELERSTANTFGKYYMQRRLKLQPASPARDTCPHSLSQQVRVACMLRARVGDYARAAC
eukprot:12581442-Alexandrium_andersonii.AAC.1